MGCTAFPRTFGLVETCWRLAYHVTPRPNCLGLTLLGPLRSWACTTAISSFHPASTFWSRLSSPHHIRTTPPPSTQQCFTLLEGVVDNTLQGSWRWPPFPLPSSRIPRQLWRAVRRWSRQPGADD